MELDDGPARLNARADTTHDREGVVLKSPVWPDDLQADLQSTHG